MKKLKSFAISCPIVVHEKILDRLDSLPDRSMKTHTASRSIAIAAALALVMLFGTAWAINPVLDQGVTFRQGVAKFLGFNPRAQELIEAPLPAADIAVLPKGGEPFETVALTPKDGKEIQVPTVKAAGYIFKLDGQSLYDGDNLVIGYSVRREDGFPMPSVEEFTKDHLAGYIRAFDLTIDGQVVKSYNGNFDWSDPYAYHQTCSYGLKELKTPLTSQSEIVLRVAVHQYDASGMDTGPAFAELPFSVDTQHANETVRITPIKTVFDCGDFTVKVQPIAYSVMHTQITIRAFKKDDPEFGKRMDGKLGIAVKDMSGNLFPCPPNSELGNMGYQEDGNGFTSMEYNWFIDPTFKLPKRFQLILSGYDGSGARVGNEPIVIELP